MVPEPIDIRRPDPEAFAEIVRLISLFELDDRKLMPSEFLSAVSGEKLLGFGRIRHYATCTELCSLGVIEPRRHRGIGRALTRALIGEARQPLYLVCIIPDFFERLGFGIVSDYPSEIAGKLAYCREALCVPETYVVMKYKQAAPEANNV